MIRPSLIFVLAVASGTVAYPQEKKTEPAKEGGETVVLRGRIVGARDGEALPARLYVEDESGAFFHVHPAGPEGRAVEYDKKRGEKSVEVHTSLSAHPFEAALPPGRYIVTAERGPEYLPARVEIELRPGAEAETVDLRPERWIDMARRGWFSGDTHCHRTLEELPVVMLAEDLNVALPLTSWVSDSTHTPKENNKNPDPVPPPRLVHVDDTHVIWPVNTEYEIGTVEGKRHVLGAVFALNHTAPLEMAVPPVAPFVEEARKQGALFDLDKQNWPWSMMLPPVIGASGLLFELSNNHVWRAEFAFSKWYPEYVPESMNLPLRGGKEFDERGWLEFGFRTWYALLNCGLRVMPTAGTASGVHPVPLGFGRVYARMEDGDFTYEKWIQALRRGGTFVTTGPMLFVTVAERHPGETVKWSLSKRDGDRKKDDDDEKGEEGPGSGEVPVICRIESARPIRKCELIVNGEATELEIGGRIGARAPHSAMIRAEVALKTSAWIAVRVFTETEDGRARFAHTAPVWVEVEGKPLLPKVLEADYLLKRVEAEIERNEDVLSKEALEEFREAAKFFREKRELALDE
ncbi:MAG: CehA/McbA family metallohydrolase [Verrucomicrobiae bacterium]|nr:CehA/McbA family metallohydrolase [Verrucomicrobiae bacterium]